VLFIDGGLGLILFGLWIFCIIDVITTDESRVRNLPKAVWVLIVLFTFDVGSIVWLVAGHPWPSGASRSLPYKGNTGQPPVSRFPEYDRPGRFAATNPDDDEAFLAQVRDRAEQQRREYQARREAELAREQNEERRRPDDES
jgi:hypothetical protein